MVQGRYQSKPPFPFIPGAESAGVERIPETYRALFDLAEKGEIRPLIYREYPLADVAEALAALGSRQSWGKVILAP